MFKSSDGLIEWRYIQDLYNLQEELGLRFANRLSRTHIYFFNNKMKVKFAAQVLSSSVADAIDFLRSANVPQFLGSEATVRFIRLIDMLFDFLNSRNPFAKGFKRPIFSHNIPYIQRKINEWISYLTDLKTANNIPLRFTRRKCFVIGFIMSLKSVLSVAIDLLETPFYRYILTFKFSQDHLELFFGKIRLRLGCNNNPNALQLKQILRKLLLKNSIFVSAATNCSMFQSNDDDGVFAITGGCSRRQKINCVIDDNDDNDDVELKDLCQLPELDVTSYLKENVLFYVAGVIVFRVLPLIKCKECASALRGTQEHCYSKGIHSFTVFKNRGGLCIPSSSVFSIVSVAEKFVQFYCKDLSTLRGQKILYNVKREFFADGVTSLFSNLQCDECDLDSNPKLTLFTLICKRYLKIRYYSLERHVNDRISERNKSLKNVLRKNM